MRDLRRLVAGNVNLPIENLSLILRGCALCDTKNGDDVSVQLNDEGIVLVLVWLFDKCIILPLLKKKKNVLWHFHLKIATASVVAFCSLYYGLIIHPFCFVIGFGQISP